MWLICKIRFYHFHPRSSDWNELAFLDVMLNLGEESWVPALYPLELLGLDKKSWRGLLRFVETLMLTQFFISGELPESKQKQTPGSSPLNG